MSQAAIHQTEFRNLNRPDRSDFGPIPRAAWIEHRVPSKPLAGCCPHCMQELQDGPQTTIHRIRWAVVQLFSAVVAIAFLRRDWPVWQSRLRLASWELSGSECKPSEPR